jgi:DNA invertase Pin-like site-specific DNA recombinase
LPFSSEYGIIGSYRSLTLRVAIYCRVSTAHQDDEAQHAELVTLALRSGWKIVRSYREVVSGTKGVDARPQLQKLLLEARQRKFDKVVVWSADRLARSMRHLVNVLHELKSCNVELFSYKQGVDTSTPMGAMLWQFLGIFAEFEHGIRRERQAIGIAKAKEKGVRFGRPRVPPMTRRQIVALRKEGLGINNIARTLRVGTGSVYRALRAAGLPTKMEESGASDSA